MKKVDGIITGRMLHIVAFVLFIFLFAPTVRIAALLLMKPCEEKDLCLQFAQQPFCMMTEFL